MSPDSCRHRHQNSLTVSPLSDGLLISCFCRWCDVIIDPHLPSASGRHSSQNPESCISSPEISGCNRSQLRESTLFYGWSPRLEASRSESLVMSVQSSADRGGYVLVKSFRGAGLGDALRAVDSGIALC